MKKALSKLCTHKTRVESMPIVTGKNLKKNVLTEYTNNNIAQRSESEYKSREVNHSLSWIIQPHWKYIHFSAVTLTF